MSESDILADILVAVSSLPDALFYRQNSGLLLSPNGRPVRAAVPGAPDITGVYRGRAVGIEVKTQVGRQSQQQRRFQDAWEAAGGLYVLARSRNEALAALNA